MYITLYLLKDILLASPPLKKAKKQKQQTIKQKRKRKQTVNKVKKKRKQTMKTLKVDLIAIKLGHCVVKTALLQSCISMYFYLFLAL